MKRRLPNRFRYLKADIPMPKLPTTFKVTFLASFAVTLTFLGLMIWGIIELILLIQRS